MWPVTFQTPRLWRDDANARPSSLRERNGTPIRAEIGAETSDLSFDFAVRQSDRRRLGKKIMPADFNEKENDPMMSEFGASGARAFARLHRYVGVTLLPHPPPTRAAPGAGRRDAGRRVA